VVKADFFEIKKIRVYEKSPKEGEGIWQKITLNKKNKKGKPLIDHVLVPYIEVELEAEEQIRAKGLITKVYFYEDKRTSAHEVKKPSSYGGKELRRHKPILPVFLKGGVKKTVYFAIPSQYHDKLDRLKFLVVFGDQNDVAVESYSKNKVFPGFVEFTEKELYLKGASLVERKPEMSPLIETVIETGVKEQPKITLFLRPPPGMKDASEARGVLALCVIAGRVDGIRRQLRGLDKDSPLKGHLKFAAEQKLLVLCWGSRTVRKLGTTWDEIDPDVYEQQAEAFDVIADEWAKEVDKLAERYGFSNKHFLLWGISDAGQYVLRLAMRKPEYFLAVHSEVPNGFDKPLEKGNQVYWCITTGELDFCYQRSLRYLKACREMDYPIIYKAIMGIGHKTHPSAKKLGMKFFRWALENKKYRINRAQLKAEYEEEMRFSDPSQTFGLRWIKPFETAPFYADVVNQEVYPQEKQNMIPEGFKIALPTQEFAKLWQEATND